MTRRLSVRANLLAILPVLGLLLPIGLALALVAGRVLSTILFEVSPADPISLAVAVALLSGAALLACYLPARRATRVSPLKALRTE